MILLGVDTGGTFTDFVLWRDGAIHTRKIPSTPAAPDQAIWQGITELNLADAVKAGAVVMIHGTTVATNAALEGKGCRTVFITNRGFADMLTLGRQNRPDIYQLQPAPLTPPVPENLCLEIDTRRGADGEVITPLRPDDLQHLVATVEELNPDAVAINLLYSYLCPDEEIAIEKALPSTVFISRSSAVLPEYKEYERGIATWLNAYLGPLMHNYLHQLQRRLHPSAVTVMQSSGGTIAADVAADKAVNLLLSGPAGGLAAVKFLRETAGLAGLMTFDMGGTSTDVALVAGELTITNEGRIGPYPVAVPMVDMHTIGAGGGSIAYIDAGGLLQVGPQSAGADPGPACYGRGGKQATVTDANVVLERLPAANKLGGTLTLDIEAAQQAVTVLAEQLQLTVEQAAQGIIDIANEHMARALRVISVQRGHDPADFRLCSFGGAGGLHVCALADHLNMTRALVPIQAGVLSALGLLVAPRERQLSRSIQAAIDSLQDAAVSTALANLGSDGQQQLINEGVAPDLIQQHSSVDVRYLGQSAHINVDYFSLAQCQHDFQLRHQQLYGHQLNLPIELVNIRQRVYAQPPTLSLPTIAKHAPIDPERSGELPIYQRHTLGWGATIVGPALICEKTATTYLAKQWRCLVDQVGNLLLEKPAA